MFARSCYLLLTLIATATVAAASGNACQDCWAAASSDRVLSLPGWNQPLPSPWYSGYLTYDFEDQTIHTHYVLVLGEDDNDKKNNNAQEQQGCIDQPLIYWSNGGPGASSMFGLLTELGPLILDDRSLRTDEYRTTHIPSLQYNPFSWNKLGTLLVLDQPAPVGFSYCNEEAHNATACGDLVWTDELASLNAFVALRAFYQKFPCFQSADLYLTGESYAGIYIPTLAQRVLQYNNQTKQATTSKPQHPIPLKGLAVGDGCLGTETGICSDLSDTATGFGGILWHVLFLAGHAQIPLSTYHHVMDACYQKEDHQSPPFRWNSKRTETSTDTMVPKRTPACQAALDKAEQQCGGFFEYSLYDDCTYENGFAYRSLTRHGSLSGALNDYACGGANVMTSWLDISAVQRALHVDESSFFNVDNAGGGFPYTPTEPDLTGFYQDVVSHQKIRVLIYNGDTDPAITSFAAQNWTSSLGFREEQAWRPWTVDACRRVGGYVTRYENDFDFLTIRGAGHMVPTYKPAATFAFMQAWIRNEVYPTYNKTCLAPPAVQENLELRNSVNMDQ